MEDINEQQVLEAGKQAFPQLSDQDILDKFSEMKNATGLNNYETLLMITKLMSENNKQSQPASPSKGRFDGLQERLRR